MTLPLPESLAAGWVRCRIIEAIPDTTDDIDELPEAKGAADVTVVLTPSAEVARVIDANYPAFVRTRPWRFPVGADGWIRDANSNTAIALVAGVWTVSFEGHPAKPGSGLNFPAFAVLVEATHTKAAPLDLAAAAPHTPDPVVIQQTPLPVGGDGVLIRDPDGTLRWGPVAASHAA